MRDNRWGRVAYGVIALIVGLAFLLVPGFTLAVVLFLFGIFLIIAGLIMIGFSRSRAPGTHRWANIVEGLILIGLGLFMIFDPNLTAVAAIYLVGIFLAIAGLFMIFEGLLARRGTMTFGASNRWILVIGGLIVLGIGVLLLIFPGSGVLAVLWLIGIFLVIVGIINIVSGLRMSSTTTPTTTTR